jgi:uncharacterized repeat protein (TIGR02543 family)
MRRIFAVIGLSLTVLLATSLTLVSSTLSNAAGSTIPVFVIDANNTSTFSYTGSTVNSAVTESANNISGTANSLTYEAGSITNALIFGPSRYLNFSNNVKPDVTNGASIQLVAYFTSSSYNGTWPRLLAFGSTTGWGSGNDEFSIQLSDSGQMQVYLNKSGTSGVYTCGTSSNAILANQFAMYSIQVGPGGVCRIVVNGSSQGTGTSEATTTYASRVPSVSNTWNFRVGSMSNAVQSTIPDGKIRSLVFSSGTASTNSVTFMENGGAGFMASQIGSSSANLNSNTLTRSGYTFTGWNTKSDGTGTPYSNGASFNFATNSALLYAQWEVPTPTLSLPELSAATYRTGYSVNLAINTAGRYTFYDSGKRIAGCINILGTPPTITCNWKPTKIGSYSISAMGRVNSSTYYSNSSRVMVNKRTNNR